MCCVFITAVSVYEPGKLKAKFMAFEPGENENEIEIASESDVFRKTVGLAFGL